MSSLQASQKFEAARRIFAHEMQKALSHREQATAWIDALDCGQECHITDANRPLVLLAMEALAERERVRYESMKSGLDALDGETQDPE